MASAALYIEKKIRQRQVVLFTKKSCPECQEVKLILSKMRILTIERYEVVEIDKRTDCSQFQDYLWTLSNLTNRVVPVLFINGNYYGSYDDIVRLYQAKRLKADLERIVHALDPVPPEPEQIIFHIAEIDQTDIVVQLVEPDFGPNDNQEEDLVCEKQPACLAFDPWLDMPTEPSQSDRLSVVLSYMDDESSHLDLMRRSISSAPGDSSRDINPSSDVTLTLSLETTATGV